MAEECEEPGCRYPATKEWEGRKVCNDHHDFYREQYEKIMMRLQGL